MSTIPRIQHNIAAMNAYRNYSANSNRLTSNLEKLSSGYKINRAGDDAAGLAISEKMRAQITGLSGAKKNATDGISLIQTAEGALTEVHDMLNRMVTLTEQSANGTYSDDVDREQLQKEVDALKSEINRVADSTNFNGLKLLDGSLDAERATTKEMVSGITAVKNGDYNAQGASPAFEATYINDRPAARTTQENASFTIDLSDVDFSAATGDSLTLNVNGSALTVTLADTVTTAASAAAELIAAGTAAATHGMTDADGNPGVGNTTGEWATALATSAHDGTDGDSYVMIDNHAWKMELTAGSNGAQSAIKFTQVDNMGATGEVFDPQYRATVTAEAGTGNPDPVVGQQQPNPQVIMTSAGQGIGTSQQARVDVALDFSKLKDGDQLTVGSQTFTFAVGAESKYGANANPAYTPAASSEHVIDLSSIFTEESDQLDENKQNQALAAIVSGMGAATGTGGAGEWTTGNGTIDENVATLTFQSIGNYSDGTHNIGDNAQNGGVIMDGEANVMSQFYSKRPESAATTSFEIDATKIKVGDTFQIDGKTFEFTDGATASNSKNVAIDLSGLGVAGGLQSYQSNAIANEIKTYLAGGQTTTQTGAPRSVNAALTLGASNSPRYDVAVNGNKVTLTSKDDTGTTAEFENRVSAKVELPTETSYGKALTLQIGDTSDDFNKLSVNVKDMHVDSMGIGDIDISTQEGAAEAMDKIKSAVNYVSDVRGGLGALQNRLDHTINNIGVMIENIQSAEGAIRDTDVAEEMMSFTKNTILNQSAQAMLAQANQLPQGVLQLIG